MEREEVGQGGSGLAVRGRLGPWKWSSCNEHMGDCYKNGEESKGEPQGGEGHLSQRGSSEESCSLQPHG